MRRAGEEDLVMNTEILRLQEIGREPGVDVEAADEVGDGDDSIKPHAPCDGALDEHPNGINDEPS